MLFLFLLSLLKKNMQREFKGGKIPLSYTVLLHIILIWIFVRLFSLLLFSWLFLLLIILIIVFIIFFLLLVSKVSSTYLYRYRYMVAGVFFPSFCTVCKNAKMATLELLQKTRISEHLANVLYPNA